MDGFGHTVQFHSLPVTYAIRYNVMHKKLYHILAIGHHQMIYGEIV